MTATAERLILPQVGRASAYSVAARMRAEGLDAHAGKRHANDWVVYVYGNANEAGAVPAEGGGQVATETQAPKRQRGQAPKSLKAAREVMAANKDAFDKYEAARLERRDLEGGESNAKYADLTAVMDANREGFTAYWRAYNSEPAKAQRLKEREAKRSKAEQEKTGRAASKAGEKAAK